MLKKIYKIVSIIALLITLITLVLLSGTSLFAKSRFHWKHTHKINNQKTTRYTFKEKTSKPISTDTSTQNTTIKPNTKPTAKPTDTSKIVNTSTPTPPRNTNQAKGVWRDMYFQPFKSTSGRSGQYHLYGEMSPNTQTGLMIYLHGDGADEFKGGENSSFLNEIVKVGKTHNLLPLALKTPSSDTTWWKEGKLNAAYLNDFFVNYLLKEYNIEKRRVLLVGYSGGAEIITENFLLNYAQNLFLGGTMLFGGGSVQYGMDNRINYNDNFINGFKFHYYSGTDDYMYEEAKYGANFFKKFGFTVTADHPQGKDHYDMPIKNVIENKLNAGFLK